MRRPVFIAEHARNAHGIVGRIIAGIMARETRGDNLWAIETLAPKPGEHILDLGTGHGAALSELAARTQPAGSVTGVDPSGLMTRMAASRNSDLIRSGQVRVVHATADNLPLEDGSFDRAMAVHVVYFWRDLAKPLKEMARVLKPGGVFVLLFRSQGDPRVAAFPEQVYTFRTVGQVTAALEAAGFQIDKINPSHVDRRSVPIVVKAMRTGERLPQQ